MHARHAQFTQEGMRGRMHGLTAVQQLPVRVELHNASSLAVAKGRQKGLAGLAGRG